jgi:predicted XRE-type DNA-binding protein
MRDQELYRAQEIVKIAERTGRDVGQLLNEYNVAKSVIDEMDIEIKQYVPKAKKVSMKDKLEAWAKDHIGQTINGGKQIAEDLGISYPTANNFIQSRRDIFSKIKKGEYLVKDADAERQEANKS